MGMFSVEELGQEIAVLAVHIDAATHRLLECIRHFDEAGGWYQQGAMSCAHWLAWRVGGIPRPRVRRCAWRGRSASCLSSTKR